MPHPTPQPTITPVHPHDIPELLPFLLAARADMFPKLHNTPIPADLAAFEQVYLRGQGRFLVAKAQGRIIGAIGYLPYDRRFPGLDYVDLQVVEVVRLFVLPEYRRGGIARGLYQALQDMAQAAGVQVVYLHTHPFLAGAVDFWHRQGFELIGVDPDPLWQTTHMQRRLPS
ncbi:GNAT family N-acetyltransferase [Pseudomonas sp. UBA4194]|uniref:GNAT family N-acetyltransferase n=1 Tax=Pseudomonas sp. UBA4194 TaxID=1947317 RepID=UPI002600FBF4|nr:GNAT family N-acetyltransferase [Pseudomonas sp. UBA4194]